MIDQAEKRLVNPMGLCLQQSLMERRSRADHKPITFNVTQRMTKGLEEPSSSFFYGGKLTCASNCDLEHRPQSQAFIKYMKDKFGLTTQVPRLVLHVAKGVSLRDATLSRWNPYNIAAMFDVIKDILSTGFFTAQQMTIETPYKAQNSRYRRALNGAMKMDDWKNFELAKLRVATIDALQGDEMPFRRL